MKTCGWKTKRNLTFCLVLALTPPLVAQKDDSKRVTGSRREVLVSIRDRKLAVMEDGKTLRVFAVAVGAAASPSPTGDFRIVNRVAHPTYYHPGVVIPPGPQNPIGSRWLGLDRKSFGIHGTNEPGSIGRAASHGCIRLRNRDMEEFFAMVRVGDRVRIAGERDAEVAQIFRGATSADTVAQVHTAQATPAEGEQ